VFRRRSHRRLEEKRRNVWAIRKISREIQSLNHGSYACFIPPLLELRKNNSWMFFSCSLQLVAFSHIARKPMRFSHRRFEDQTIFGLFICYITAVYLTPSGMRLLTTSESPSSGLISIFTHVKRDRSTFKYVGFEILRAVTRRIGYNEL
jgi:hypothetical protein